MAATPPLTAKRAAWTKGRSGIFRGKPLRYPVGVSARYADRLTRAVERMTAETHKRLERVFNSEAAHRFFTADASLGSQARIVTNQLTSEFQGLFDSLASGAATELATGADAASKSALHASLKELTGGLSLKTSIMAGPLQETVKAIIAENVGLIKSIASKYLDGVTGEVMRAISTGEGWADLVPYLQEQHGATLRRARNIAGDQMRKAYNGINRSRMTALGIQEFEWLHGGGAVHPRPLHLYDLNGKTFRFDNLPIIEEGTDERGIPGQAIYCGCMMVPIVRYDNASE